MTQLKLVWLAVPVLEVAQQIFLKLSAQQAGVSQGGWLLQVVCSYWFLAAIVVEIACFAIWARMLSQLGSNEMFPISAISYVAIMAAAPLLFGEPITPLGLAGSALILIGVWCVSTDPARPGQ